MDGQNIKTLRIQLRLSQREFAERLGVGRRTVIRWESDLTTPDKEAQDKLMQLTQKVTGDTPNEKVTGKNEKVTGKSDILDEKVTGDRANVTGQTEKVTGKSDRVEVTGDRVEGSQNHQGVVNFVDTGSKKVVNVEMIGDPVRAYYETMYEDARGIIPLCIITQPQDSDQKPSLRVNGFYDISQMPDLLAEAERLNGNYHIYTGIHPLRERPSEGRGKEKDILGIAFFAPDVDAKDFIDNQDEKKKANEERAFYKWIDSLLSECKAKALTHIQSVCDKVSIPPTAVIDSGHGYYPIFKLEKFVEFERDQHREELKKLNKTLHEVFSADSTFDFARILRVPDTRNIKPGYPVDCKLIEFHPDRRYTLDDIRRFEKLITKIASQSKFKPQTVLLDDQELIEKAKNAKDGAKFSALWGGDISGYKSQSEADLALCCLLAFWTGGDYSRIDALFRQSGLYREKWNRLNSAGEEDYKDKTIKTALEYTTEYYDPDKQTKDIIHASHSPTNELHDIDITPSKGETIPAEEPAYIHLTDIEKAEYEGLSVITEVLLPGVGRDDSFFVPKKVLVTCSKEDKSKCDGCPLIEEGAYTYEFADDDRRLIRFTKQTDEQVRGEIRQALFLPKKCSKYKFNVSETTEIQILLAVPKAGAELRKEGGKFVDEHGRDFREKVIYYSGVVPRSNAYYQVQGTVVADPKSQRATMLANRLVKLQNEYEQFAVTENAKALLRDFQTEDESAMGIDNKMRELGRDIAYNIAHYFGEPRVNIVIADMLAWHSVLQFPFDGDIMTKGWIDLLIFGDSGINKTTHLRKLRKAIDFGYFVDGGAVSRAGLLYSLDDVHSGIRILRWGALPLNDGQLVIIDESQNISLDVWQEMSSARTTGLLTVTKAKHGEHPMRTRQIYTANPKPPNTMSSFSFPIRGIKDLMRPADMRRFDIVICAARGEVEVDEVNRLQAERGEIVPHKITPEHLKASIARAWTRRPEHVIWALGAEAAVMDMATKLQKKFGCGDIPAIDIDAKDKVARGAVAVATMLNSTDETFEPVIVKPCHAHWVGMYLWDIYSAQAAMLDKHAQVTGKMERIADMELDIILQEWQKLNPPEPEHLAEMAIIIAEGEGIERDVLAAQVGVTPRQISTLIQKFKQHRFVKSTRKGYYATPRLVRFYREKYDELSNLALH